jgi:hypothetical protein
VSVNMTAIKFSRAWTNVAPPSPGGISTLCSARRRRHKGRFRPVLKAPAPRDAAGAQPDPRHPAVSNRPVMEAVRLPLRHDDSPRTAPYVVRQDTAAKARAHRGADENTSSAPALLSISKRHNNCNFTKIVASGDSRSAPESVALNCRGDLAVLCGWASNHHRFPGKRCPLKAGVRRCGRIQRVGRCAHGARIWFRKKRHRSECHSGLV